ncbi:MAG: hypothetical protein AUK47_26580 [Deltaproteobacteria bacterium CG2_30_63_29]|nr:MAG: hypothetical protein AUK47_26580 [Deltaproteobacteria bacterium CG2_30_63_29]PJB41316.1 MAG: hypothetical protein CO108_13270 [Deltaproteobacteria bacterium CG_4_9_14_3_um_filter_63_12]
MERAKNAKLFDFMDERDNLIREVTDRVVERMRRQANLSEDKALEYVLNEAAYLEMRRLMSGSSKMDTRPYSYWHQLARRVGKATQAEKTQVLRELVGEYTEDVAGKFTPQVFWFATRVLPVGLSALFNAQSVDSLFRNFRQLGERIVIEGALDRVRSLSVRGTLIVVPTHSSNLDSILVGWALEESRLPPVTYGAGKNLFTNKLLSFFMHNLGAYKVDRRITHGIYKEVLKAYSQVLLERGYHQLFFPGGTRCRSNVVEHHLKLGLLGTALTAYTQNVINKRPHPKIFIVPLTINNQLVLEGETLISEHLRIDGGARYIIEDDEFSDLSKIALFTMNTMNLESTPHLRFGDPLDPFGNLVNAEGESLDPRGRVIDIERYLWVDGEPRPDPARDAEYTRQCGDAVVKAFRQHTVILSTAFLSFVLFRYLQGLYPDLDLYRLLRVSKGELIPFEVLYHRAEQLRAILTKLVEQNKVHLAPEVAEAPIPELVERGARVLGAYHTVKVVELRTNGIEIGNPNLVFFYANRLAGYGIEAMAEVEAQRLDVEAQHLEVEAQGIDAPEQP